MDVVSRVTLRTAGELLTNETEDTHDADAVRATCARFSASSKVNDVQNKKYTSFVYPHKIASYRVSSLSYDYIWPHHLAKMT